MTRENSKLAAYAFIDGGGHCIKRYGWSWKASRVEPSSMEEALRLLPHFGFGLEQCVKGTKS